MKDVVKLSGAYLPATQQAILEGRWRRAANPIGYIRTAAHRIALRTNMVDRDPVVVEPERIKGKRGSLVFSVSQLKTRRPPDDGAYGREALSEMSVADKIDFLNKEAVYYDPDDYDEETGDRLTTLEKTCRKISSELLIRDPGFVNGDRDLGENEARPNWDLIAQRAHLDEGQRRVLALRRLGFGRDEALRKLPKSDEDRRKLQAAWKRLDRNMDKLRLVLRPVAIADSPKLPGSSGFIPPAQVFKKKAESRRAAEARQQVVKW